MGRQLQLDFRPSTYWPSRPGTRTALSKIKGTAHRAAVLRSLIEGTPSPPDGLLRQSLTEDVRAHLGALHPAFMGGEYLPEFEPDEVEIARLDLASTTADVIAVLACRKADHIQYRVVDEYEYPYAFSPDRSKEPLTLAAIVALIDHACLPGQNATMEAYGLVEGFWEWNFRNGDLPEHAVAFVSVSSAFYPALADYYLGRAEEWIAISRRNPLPREEVATLERAWQRATEKKRESVLEFLGSHGYERGSFRTFGARHLDFVLSILSDRVAG